jgi:hypothetical protein
MDNISAGEQDVLKVDAAFFETRNALDNRRKKIVLYNVNIPARFVENLNEFTTVLDRVSDLIENDFPNDIVQFQVTAAYWLKHNQTGELKKWCGSFSVQNNMPARLSNFEEFNPVSFVQFVLTSANNLEAKLTWNRQDTNFEFYKLISIILNIQSRVDINHNAILRRQLVSHTRTTFGLP